MVDLKSWIEERGSFMQGLRAYALKPRVHLLRQGFFYPDSHEAASLVLPARRYVFIREVEIRVAEQVLMFARTVIPKSTLSGRERLLMQLGHRSLGSFLFAYPDLERSPFKIETVLCPSYSDQALWQRQSLFKFKNKQLLLKEVFLPDFLEWVEHKT